MIGAELRDFDRLTERLLRLVAPPDTSALWLLRDRPVAGYPRSGQSDPPR
jgi:hypothetical protein